MWIFVGALVSLAGVVAVSYIVEALRPAPARPATLPWAPAVPIAYIEVDGIKLRYVKTGAGPNLVLLHTLRTQLDLFQKMIPLLARHFTVHAFDYPGHGWSDIPRAAYAPEDFYSWASAFFETIDAREAIVVGVSIGATIALVLAARRHPRVTRVVAVNPYDYWPAGGLRKSSLAARLVLSLSDVPIVGATFMRLRNRFVSDRIFEGGVAASEDMPRSLAAELYEVGARRGHYQAFLSLLAHERRWPEARAEYGHITVPVLLVYGDQDWAPAADRERTRSLIPNVVAKTLRNSSHFLPLDRPQELHDLIVDFARR